jgi:hypothetical protein
VGLLHRLQNSAFPLLQFYHHLLQLNLMVLVLLVNFLLLSRLRLVQRLLGVVTARGV